MLERDVFAARREAMVEHAIAGRGVRSERVLQAMRTVPREAFLPPSLAEFAYEDVALPVAAGQTSAQPYIVALMTEALDLRGDEKVLEVGTGSGYGAAVLAHLATQVYTVERIGQLAEKAASALADLGIANVHVLHADGTHGWPEHAPFDAIVVRAGGPIVPETLKRQLRVGGHLVVAVGKDARAQELVRVTRVAFDEYATEDLAGVRLAPLIGDEAWREGALRRAPARALIRREAQIREIARRREPFASIEAADLAPLLRRIGDARVVLLGEATHGTSEFYRMRARISRELIEKRGFSFVAIEGDWPDAARIDRDVRHVEGGAPESGAFERFPTWMWRNREVFDFVDWLRAYNRRIDPARRVAFHGLDLYSLYGSIAAVVRYLDDVDPATAQVARHRYACLTPWQGDPATYGHAALTGSYQSCEREVVSMLADLLERERTYAARDGERFLDAAQNARLVANAERYYRTMYYGSRASWNLRDSHMFETLSTLLDHHGAASRAIVWAHNSHVGNAAATEMAARGEYNIGELCRKAFGAASYAIGFGTHAGTVAAASDWDGDMEVKRVRPSLDGSYEALCHDAGEAHWLLPLRAADAPEVAQALASPLLERAIGVIYRPRTERESHYFEAVLPAQFDEYVWFDQTAAVTPLATKARSGMPETYPFGV